MEKAVTIAVFSVLDGGVAQGDGHGQEGFPVSFCGAFLVPFIPLCIVTVSPHSRFSIYLEHVL